MKKYFLRGALFSGAFALSAFGQNQFTSNAPVRTATPSTAQTKADTETLTKAGAWVDSLRLNDPAKVARVREVIATHLKTVRDWHNEHPFTAVPAGINPITGKPLSQLDRQLIVNSTIPKSVHEKLMTGLSQELSSEQVEAILDKYTVGKVAFTLTGYRAIVPDLTKEEEAAILAQLKEAREEAVDYKNMDQISTIFKIHKTRIEQYLNDNGRNWKAMYKAYFAKLKSKPGGTNAPGVEP